MRIGLFGGSFNPPHVCHALVTIWTLQTQPVDEIWWIPTYKHAFSKELVGYDDRRRMCEVAIRDMRRVEICDVERDLGGESRTIDTVRELEARRPEADFSLIVGSDILDETDQWKEWDELVDRVDLVVVRRAGYEGEVGGAMASLELPDVSSSRIRHELASGEREWLQDWVPAAVLDYIADHDLYGANGPDAR